MAGRPREFDQTEVIKKAAHVFRCQGYQGAGLSDLVRETGVGRQSLYNTFGDKKGLFLRALEAYQKERFEPIVRTLNQPGRAINNIRSILAQFREELLSGDFNGCLVTNSIAEFGAAAEDLSPALRECTQNLEDALTDALGRAQQEGDLPADRKPRDLASTLLCMVLGLSLLARIAAPKSQIDAIVSTAYALLE